MCSRERGGESDGHAHSHSHYTLSPAPHLPSLGHRWVQNRQVMTCGCVLLMSISAEMRARTTNALLVDSFEDWTYQNTSPFLLNSDRCAEYCTRCWREVPRLPPRFPRSDLSGRANSNAGRAIAPVRGGVLTHNRRADPVSMSVKAQDEVLSIALPA